MKYLNIEGNPFNENGIRLISDFLLNNRLKELKSFNISCIYIYIQLLLLLYLFCFIALSSTIVLAEILELLSQNKTPNLETLNFNNIAMDETIIEQFSNYISQKPSIHTISMQYMFYNNNVNLTQFGSLLFLNCCNLTNLDISGSNLHENGYFIQLFTVLKSQNLKIQLQSLNLSSISIY